MNKGNLSQVKKKKMCVCVYIHTNKGLSSQNFGFSSSHVCIESWTIKKAERQRTDTFGL